MRLYTLEEVQDELIGPIGTPRRDAFESKLAAELEAYKIGEALKKARKEQNLTQKKLGEMVGVKEAQISKIENGKPRFRQHGQGSTVVNDTIAV